MLVEIAAELGCTDRTVSRWRLKYAEFGDALDKGRDRRAAERLAEALEARRRDAETKAKAKAASDAALREAALALQEMLKDIPVGIGKASRHGTSEPSVLPVRRPRDFDGQPTFHNFDGEPVPFDDPLADW
ncbi:helix-turn-helix domain containing protein [Mesorhizobium sp. M1405]